jgi:hypothetical protein
VRNGALVVLILVILAILFMLYCGQTANADPFTDIFNKIGKQIEKFTPLAITDNQLGSYFAESIEKQSGLDSDPVRNNRVNIIGQKIISSNTIGNKYDFAVLSSHDFNACAIYGGHVRVNEGLLHDTTNNDAEAAFAIAHEIAHNELGHTKETVKTFRITYTAQLIGITKKTPELLLAAVNAVMAKKSREHESAADYRALELMAKAGYKTTGAIAMARRIEAEHTLAQKRSGNTSLISQRFNGIFDTHPEPAKRAEMAEDFLFTQQYGSTFKQVAGAETASNQNSIFGDCPIIVAHPSLWLPILKNTNRISGVGIFNPIGSEKTDFEFFLNVCQSGNLIAATADNDSHDYISASGEGTGDRFTFVQSNSTNSIDVINAVRACKTYASHDGTTIKDMSFSFGKVYQKVNSVSFTFKLVFQDGEAINDKVRLYRDGEYVDSYEPNQEKYTIEDPGASIGPHWYVLYLPGKLVTSPIAVDVTNDSRDRTNFTDKTRWQKGIIHYHSFYSDGKTKSIQRIWDAGQSNGNGFIFMTDHADKFSDLSRYQQYSDDCARASATSMVAGIEYPIGKVILMNHLLVLNLKRDQYLQYHETSEDEFFNGLNSYPDKVCIIRDQFHLGDDFSENEMEKDAVFQFSNDKDATLKMWIKGSPFKDPIIWINRHEVGRVTTTDGKWHLYPFNVKPEWLYNGRNLFQIESYIPDRFHTFDDCEVKEVWITKN